MKEEIIIREGTISEAVKISNEIEEFDNPHPASIYANRMKGKDNLILIATVDKTLVGFKVGYDKFGDGSFYTWMGGVKSGFRRSGIARMLANTQEDYVKSKGYDSIILKTRNRHKNMLIFALDLGFKITEVLTHEGINENRIVLKKIID